MVICHFEHREKSVERKIVAVKLPIIFDKQSHYFQNTICLSFFIVMLQLLVTLVPT